MSIKKLHFNVYDNTQSEKINYNLKLKYFKSLLN